MNRYSTANGYLERKEIMFLQKRYESGKLKHTNVQSTPASVGDRIRRALESNFFLSESRVLNTMALPLTPK